MREALRGVTPEEESRLFEAADSLHAPNHSPGYVGWLVRCLLDYGWHLAVLYDPSESRLRIEGDHVLWNRPKKKVVRGDGSVKYRPGRSLGYPISTRTKPFLEAFLKEDRMSSSTYKRYLQEVERKAGVKLNLLRLRHGHLQMLDRKGIPPGRAMRLSGTTPGSWERYVAAPIEEIAEELKQKGF